MAHAIKGMLIECDPSIKALIIKIDAEDRDIVIEDLDDTHLLVEASRIPYVKKELNKLLAKNTYNAEEEAEAQNN